MAGSLSGHAVRASLGVHGAHRFRMKQPAGSAAGLRLLDAARPMNGETL